MWMLRNEKIDNWRQCLVTLPVEILTDAVDYYGIIHCHVNCQWTPVVKKCQLPKTRWILLLNVNHDKQKHTYMHTMSCRSVPALLNSQSSCAGLAEHLHSVSKSDPQLQLVLTIPQWSTFHLLHCSNESVCKNRTSSSNLGHCSPQSSTMNIYIFQQFIEVYK